MLCPTSFPILCISRNEPHLHVDISMGSLPSSFCFPICGGRGHKGDRGQLSGQCCALPRDRTTQNHRLLKDQRQREKLAPKPGHSLEVIDYKNKKQKNPRKNKKQNRFLCMRVFGKVLYLCIRQNIQVSKYSDGLLTLNLLLLLSTPKDVPTRWEVGCVGRLTSPSASLYTQQKCSKMSLRTGGLT